jgi:hypothetical protein
LASSVLSSEVMTGNKAIAGMFFFKHNSQVLSNSVSPNLFCPGIEDMFSLRDCASFMKMGYTRSEALK